MPSEYSTEDTDIGHRGYLYTGSRGVRVALERLLARTEERLRSSKARPVRRRPPGI